MILYTMTETTQTAPAPTIAQLRAAHAAALETAQHAAAAREQAETIYRAALATLDKATAAYVTARNAQPA